MLINSITLVIIEDVMYVWALGLALIKILQRGCQELHDS